MLSGRFGSDALVALSQCGPTELGRLLETGAILVKDDGFCVSHETLAILGASNTKSREWRAARLRLGAWLLEHLENVERSSQDTSTAFAMMETSIPDVRRVLTPFATEEPELAARLWCSIADVLFYRRPLPFDVPEYALAIKCADRARVTEVRALARIVAGRASLEVREPAIALSLFKEAARLARRAERTDLHADALRGLGWARLASADIAGAESLFEQARVLHESISHARGLADAWMALGVVRALRSDPVDADRLLFRAEAILRSRSDTVRLAKLGTTRDTLGLHDKRLPGVGLKVEDLLDRGQYWRAALLLAREEDPIAKERARVLASLAGVRWEELLDQTRCLTESAPAPGPAPRGWVLERHGRKRVLVSPGDRRFDITRRSSIVRVLDALAVASGPTPAIELFAAAWPGERVRHEAALYRVYTTIRRLRRLGVPIGTSGDGYFCECIRAPA